MVWGCASSCGALRFCEVRWGYGVQVGAGCWWFCCCCFPFLCLFPCAWVGPIDLLLRDLIVLSCRPVGGGPPYLNVNAGSLTIKKKKKKKRAPGEKKCGGGCPDLEGGSVR